jgi:hypothetical protein
MKIFVFEFNLGVLGGEAVVIAENEIDALLCLDSKYNDELKSHGRGKTWYDVIHTKRVYDIEHKQVIHFWNGDY